MLMLQDDIEVVAMARNGEEAIALAQKFQPDLAVIDIHMPRMDGVAAIRELARVSPATICMAISYDEQKEVLREAMNAGAREYLVKPFGSDEFINAIHRLGTEALQARQKAAPAPPSEAERDQQLWQQAMELLKAGRQDAEARQVYAELIARPHLDPKLLTHLAKVFFERRDWTSLRLVCERMENLAAPPPS